jgi:hypothetical protein
MKNKKNFRIKRSAKFEEVIAKSQLFQKSVEKIVGGETAYGRVVYSRYIGLIELPPDPLL